MIKRVLEFFSPSGSFPRKIDLGYQSYLSFGRHRSGLTYGLEHLKALQAPNGAYFDVFVERTFCWGAEGPKPYTRPWVGIIHVPPRVPDWFAPEQTNEAVFRTAAWKESLPYCRGLFTMSKYHRKHLESLVNVPVNNLFFPGEVPTVTWSWDRFEANREKMIVQVGWWLRMLHAIYLLPETPYQKVFLDVEHDCLPGLMAKERELLLAAGTFQDGLYQTAQSVKYLPNAQYDKLLGENIVFVYLYDASANNTVAECLARNTPLLINPIEPVQEYLGKHYPFYYRSFEEAAQKAMDLDLVYQTHQYLVRRSAKEKMSGENFRKSVARSRIYRNL